MALDPTNYRDRFPFTQSWNYLNHATHGPLPTTTTDTVCELVRGWHSPPDLDHGENARTTTNVRSMIAGLINGCADGVAFTGNLAESISLAACGIDWKDGDNCVIPEDEFPSVVYPFLNLAHRGVEVRFAPKGDDGFTSLDRVRDLMDSRTRAVAMSHVEFQTGFRNDLSALAELCHAGDALAIVDVTQSIGPCRIDIAESGVDVVAAHSYKWLMASYGVGVTHLSDRAIERIRPTYAGRLTVDHGFEDTVYELTYREGADRYQTGGLNWITLAGLESSLELISSIGTEAMADHTIGLTERLLDGLESIGYTIRSSRDPMHRSAIVSFSSGDRERDEAIVEELESRKISVALRGRGVRVSPYFYNTADEIDHFLESLPPATAS